MGEAFGNDSCFYAFSLFELTSTILLEWGAVICLSKEEVKFSMFEAYMCYALGTKIMVDKTTCLRFEWKM